MGLVKQMRSFSIEILFKQRFEKSNIISGRAPSQRIINYFTSKPHALTYFLLILLELFNFSLFKIKSLLKRPTDGSCFC